MAYRSSYVASLIIIVTGYTDICTYYVYVVDKVSVAVVCLCGMVL